MPDESPPQGPLTPRALAPQVPPGARSVLAVCAGLFVGGLMIMFIERLGHFVAPPPDLPNAADPQALRAAMASMDTRNFLLLLVAYIVGPTIGCWMAARMARRHEFVHAAIVGGVFLLGVVMNFTRIPHPTWFVVATIAAFVAAPFLGTRMAGR